MKKNLRPKIDLTTLDLTESVLDIKRVAKVVKGGRRFKLRALVAVGNKNGYVGIGIGKATETADAIKKATEAARKNIVKVYINSENGSIPYEVIGKHGASKILLKPAVEGTGIIATEIVRNILELAGIRNILTKSLGSNTTVNLAKATLNAITSVLSPEEIYNMKKGKISDVEKEVVNG